jgi:hypothetical protein
MPTSVSNCAVNVLVNTNCRAPTTMPWPISKLRNAWRVRSRQRALQARLSTLTAQEYQSVRAYLSVNGGDEAFIRDFLASEPRSEQRRR